MKKVLLAIILCCFSIPSLHANKAIIKNVTIVNQNEESFIYEPIFNNKLPFKYLLSNDVVFKIEGNNLEGYKYKGSLIVEIDQERFESLVYDTRSSEEVIFFNIESIREKVIELEAELLRFYFCPNGIDNSDCTYSQRIIITRDKSTYDDTFASFQYYLEDSNIIKAKESTQVNYTPVIAVIDDGISIQHDDLEGQSWINKGEINGNGIDDDNNGYIDDYYGWNFIDDDNFMLPKGDHGTNVAGIISAVTDNDLGISGISNSSQLMSLIGCSEEGCGSENIISSMTYAIDNGADIINLSIGGQWFNYNDDISEVIKYANESNVLVVISLGNGDILTGNGLDTTNYKISPVCNEIQPSDVIGVSALSIYSELSKDGLLTDWTNYGSCADIYAYGESIVTLTKDGSYSILDGTSFSAPIITGIIALGYNNYGKLDKELVYESLIKAQNKWHGIDAMKYLEFVEEGIERELDEENKEDTIVEEKELDDENKEDTIVEEDKNQALYDRLDSIERKTPGILLKLLPILREIKTQEKYMKYEEIIDIIIDYIEVNY